MKKISFAIIGGGPAAFYTSKLLARLRQEPIVHMIQKQLCPFGLLRYGVAPDHISIKRAELTLSDAASYPNFKYFGNTLIKNQDIQQLKDRYSGVIYAYGASGNSRPEWVPELIPEEFDDSVKYAREIVYWYNNHPNYEKHKINLDGVKNVAIIGNGNVAIDVARIFLRQPKDLSQTQISKNALEQLKDGNIQTIQIIGRRGVTHSAFALKQVRQLARYKIKLYAIQEQLQDSMTESSNIECTALGNHFSSAIRMNKRKINFIKQQFEIISQDQIQKVKQLPDKKIIFRYLQSPENISKNQIKLRKNYLTGQPFKQIAKPTQNTSVINYDMLVLSVGFEVNELFQNHYDDKRKKVSHSDGCVIKVNENKIDIGTYAVGWCKNGPKGVIDETLLSCQETFNNLRIHLDNKLLKEKQVPQAFSSKIDFEKYLELRQEELKRGNKQKFIKGKLSEKQIKEFYGL